MREEATAGEGRQRRGDERRARRALEWVWRPSVQAGAMSEVRAGVVERDGAYAGMISSMWNMREGVSGVGLEENGLHMYCIRGGFSPAGGMQRVSGG